MTLIKEMPESIAKLVAREAGSPSVPFPDLTDYRMW